MPNFYPRSPCGERRCTDTGIAARNPISIHALLAESDIEVMEIGVRCPIFLSTLSLRRATVYRYRHCRTESNFYPRSPCGERQGIPVVLLGNNPISIHALLAESDGNRFAVVDILPISIHALLAESDPSRPPANMLSRQFLSTLSLRRATAGGGHVAGCHQISIHALLAESDCAGRPRSGWKDISIHALLAESDGGFHKINCQIMVFLSTLSLRRATMETASRNRYLHFYPRSPCGERQ